MGGGIEPGRVWGGGFWGASDILFLDLHGSYMSVYFMKLQWAVYLCFFYTFLYVILQWWFTKSKGYTLSVSSFYFCDVFKKFLLTPRLSIYSPCHLLKVLFYFCIWVYDPSGIDFCVWCEVDLFFSHMDIQLIQHHLLKDHSFSVALCCHLCHKWNV